MEKCKKCNKKKKITYELKSGGVVCKPCQKKIEYSAKDTIPSDAESETDSETTTLYAMKAFNLQRKDLDELPHTERWRKRKRWSRYPGSRANYYNDRDLRLKSQRKYAHLKDGYDSIHKVEVETKKRKRDDRKEGLVLALQSEGLKRRSDSSLCSEYEHPTKRSKVLLRNVVWEMDRMNYLHEATNYPSELRAYWNEVEQRREEEREMREFYGRGYCRDRDYDSDDDPVEDIRIASERNAKVTREEHSRQRIANSLAQASLFQHCVRLIQRDLLWGWEDFDRKKVKKALPNAIWDEHFFYL